MIMNIYKNQYTSEGVSNILDTIPCKLAPHMNGKLIAPYSANEVKLTHYEMFPTKASGPNGILRILPMTLGVLW